MSGTKLELIAHTKITAGRAKTQEGTSPFYVNFYKGGDNIFKIRCVLESGRWDEPEIDLYTGNLTEQELKRYAGDINGDIPEWYERAIISRR